MSRDLRRLLVALVLACSGVVLAQMPAHACKCVTESVKKDVKRADAVFTGVVVSSETEEAGDKGRQQTTYRIEAETLYKGDLSMARVEVTSRSNSCGLGDLPTDRPYLWFVSESGGDLSADLCGGTAKAGDQRVAKVERLLGAGEPLGEEPPAAQEHAEFTPVAGREPDTFNRLAAPGAALVLLGLLGLFVVRRRSRD